jgi:hypothetical protein
MSRFGVNLIPNLPATRLNNHSPLLKNFQWTNDREYIALLHGPDWMFYITALLRKHILNNEEKLFPFTARDQTQAFPYMVELMKVFNPIAILSLYFECLEYYKNCIIAELLEFNEQWYLSIVRSYHTLDDWENADWFWRFALRNVIFIPRRGIAQLQEKSPDWVGLPGTSQHSGVPETFLVDRFPDIVSRVTGVYEVVSNDLKGKPFPVINVDGAWGAACAPDSPFLHTLRQVKGEYDIDHFLLSLYTRMPGQTFSWSMSLDILQHQWTLTDWKYNRFATKHYNMLRFAEKEGIVQLNKPITSMHAAAQQSGTGITPSQQVNYEPQPFHDLRTKIQMLAADMAFDYCSDHELQLLVSDLDVLVRNAHFPRQGRASYFATLKHLRSKIQLYNMIQTNSADNSGNNQNNNNNDDDDDYDME